MLQCDGVQAVSQGVQQAFFWCCSGLIETDFRKMPYGSVLGFFFGVSNAAANLTVVVQTDDDTVTASCYSAWIFQARCSLDARFLYITNESFQDVSSVISFSLRSCWVVKPCGDDWGFMSEQPQEQKKRVVGFAILPEKVHFDHIK